jgi:hypothetical protein
MRQLHNGDDPQLNSATGKHVGQRTVVPRTEALHGLFDQEVDVTFSKN